MNWHCTEIFRETLNEALQTSGGKDLKTLSAMHAVCWRHCLLYTLFPEDTVCYTRCLLKTLSAIQTVWWRHCLLYTLFTGTGWINSIFRIMYINVSKKTLWPLLMDRVQLSQGYKVIICVTCIIMYIIT